MKSAQIVIAVLFIAGCVMNGCKEDKLPTMASISDQAPPPAGAGVLTADIDGSSWVAENLDGVASGTSTCTGNILHISGFREAVGDTADAETIELTLDLSASKAGLAPGTYNLGTIPAQEGEAQYHDALSCVCSTNSTHTGTVTITTLDASKKVVSGGFTFNGVASNGHSHTVRSGIFDVTWK